MMPKTIIIILKGQKTGSKYIFRLQSYSNSKKWRKLAKITVAIEIMTFLKAIFCMKIVSETLNFVFC